MHYLDSAQEVLLTNMNLLLLYVFDIYSDDLWSYHLTIISPQKDNLDENHQFTITSSFYHLVVFAALYRPNNASCMKTKYSSSNDQISARKSTNERNLQTS